MPEQFVEFSPDEQHPDTRQVIDFLCEQVFGWPENVYAPGHFTDRQSRFYGVVRDGRLLAAAAVHYEDDIEAELSLMATDSAVRGQGFGIGLFEVIQAQALQRGVTSMRVSPRSDESRDFFMHRGFTPDPQREDFYVRDLQSPES